MSHVLRGRKALLLTVNLTVKYMRSLAMISKCIACACSKAKELRINVAQTLCEQKIRLEESVCKGNEQGPVTNTMLFATDNLSTQGSLPLVSSRCFPSGCPHVSALSSASLSWRYCPGACMGLQHMQYHAHPAGTNIYPF